MLFHFVVGQAHVAIMTWLHDSFQNITLRFDDTHLTNDVAGVMQNDWEIVAVRIEVEFALVDQIAQQREEALYLSLIHIWVIFVHTHGLSAVQPFPIHHEKHHWHHV